jgi:hypothetical protein
MNKEKLCETLFSLFPNIDKEIIKNDITQELENNLSDYNLIQQLLILRYTDENKKITNFCSSHFLCSVCGEFDCL